MYKNLPSYLSYKNNHLHYEDVDLMDLISKYGTPLEVAYTDMINQKIVYLKECFNSSIKRNSYKGKYFYAYATKANYYSEVVSTSLNHTDFLETSSGFDLDIIEKLFTDKLIPKGFTIICNGFKKGYYFDKIVALKKKGLNITPVLEDAEEAEMFLNQNIEFNVGMRINIDEQSVQTFLSSERSGAAVDTRFGFYFEEMIEYAKKINTSKHLKFTLFHFHLGGTIHDIDKYIKFLGYLYENNYCVLKSFSDDLEFLDIGGGFPTQYSFNFKFDYEKLVEEIVKCLKKISDKYKLPCPNIIGEHGRYTVADHGFFLYKIAIVKKSKQDSFWYLINSSLMNFLPDSWALGQDFIILPLNLVKNKAVKVKLGGLTCDPDDTYYKQEKKNHLFLPEINDKEELYIGVFGTGAYQEMIAGVGGVHHCMIPEGNELIIRKNGNKLEYNNITNFQSARDMLEILDYNNTHNLIQYKDGYNIHLHDFQGDIREHYNKLKEDFPENEIFPFPNVESAYKDQKFKLIQLFVNDTQIGYAFCTLLERSKIVVLAYLCVFKEFRDKGYGHIFVNELKNYFSKYGGFLVEAEKPEKTDEDTIKTRRLKFYKDLGFTELDFDYQIKDSGKETYSPMLLLVCNLKNPYNFNYSYNEMAGILDEYYTVIFREDFEKKCKLKIGQSINSIV